MARLVMQKMFRFLSLHTWAKLAMLSLVVGLAGGLGAVVFQKLLDLVALLAIDQVLTQSQPWLRRVLIVAVPGLGGLISGILVFTFAPEAEGHGTDSMVRAFHRLRGEIRARVPFIKTLASAITIGTGGSAGKEGPIAQIGAGIGSILGKVLGLSAKHRRILMLAGAGAGVGAIFRAPLGGALFAAEVLYRETDFEYEAIVPSIVASITAYAVFVTLFGYGHLFTGVKDLQFEHVPELGLYAILGLVCALVGFVYVKVFYGSRDRFFRKLRMPNHVKPAVGGLLLGLLALWLPQVLGGGYEWIQQAIDNRLGADLGQMATSVPWHAAQLLMLLALGNIVATSFTISSGGSGGVFGPSLYIGAMLGGSFGYFVHALFPGSLSEATRVSLILVGMGGFFAGVAKVPIASLLMVTEMTGSYGLIVPLMVTCTIAFVLSQRWTLYEEQVFTQVDSPAHMGDFVVDVIRDIRVRDLFGDEQREVHTISDDTRLSEVFRLFQHSFQDDYPVLDDQGRLTGVLSFTDVRHHVTDDALGNLVVAGDICEKEIVTASLDEDLYSVLLKMGHSNVDSLPVVDRLDGARMEGLVTRKDVILAYERRLRSLREESTGGPDTHEPQAIPYRGDSALTELQVGEKHGHLAGRQVKDVNFPPGTLLVSIQRGDQSIIPNGLSRIEAGDRLLIVTKRDRVEEVQRALASTDGEPIG